MLKKNNKWLKFRHKVVRFIAYYVIYFYSRIKYGVEIEKFKEQKDVPYLILYNHQTAFDQFFVGMAFKGPVYYVASEDLFSKGWVSSLIRWLVAPIPIKKQKTDITAVKTCLRVAREGGTIAIAPEGNRTYSGKTEYMSPAIASLSKKLGLPIALYHITGGYGVHPRWSDVVRNGKMRCYVSKVIEPEEYATLNNEELFQLIEEGLYINEAVADAEFTSSKRAEYLERAMYVCPYCGLSVFESNGNEIECKKCGRKIIYETDKRITGKGFDFPYAFVSDWYDYQKDFVNNLDVSTYIETPLYTDTASLSEVIVYKCKKTIYDSCILSLFGDRITINEGLDSEKILMFSDILAISVLGRNKLNIYYKDSLYQLKSDKRFNALKYVNIYYRYKSLSKGEKVGKFLGL